MAETRIPEELIPWHDIAELGTWSQPWTKVFEAAPPFDRWYTGGALNVAVNCLDRHLADRADQTAVLWEGEPGDRLEITYQQLHDDVLRLTRSLRALSLIHI